MGSPITARWQKRRGRARWVAGLFAIMAAGGPLVGPETALGANQPPVANAGTSRYLGDYAVTLDGSGSYDPDGSGQLLYRWTQLSGPTLTLSSGTSPMPTVQAPASRTSGLAVFQLIVNDGSSDSLPDTVQVQIMPPPAVCQCYASTPSTNAVILYNPPFDPNKPTMVFFGGGDCSCSNGGNRGPAYVGLANNIGFDYCPDPYRRYDSCADLLIGFLSSVAPDYQQAIQTLGASTGGQPAIQVAVRLNTVYKDPRFAVNRVTLLDAACVDYTPDLKRFVENPVNGEPAWVENIFGDAGYVPFPRPYALNIRLPGGHNDPYRFFTQRGDTPAFYTLGPYNRGQTGGLFLSVTDQGAHYRLPAIESLPYYFDLVWDNPDRTRGHFEYADKSNYPASLPEPPALIGPASGSSVGVEAVTLGCDNSLHTTLYELLWAEQGQDLQVVYASRNPISVSTGSLPPGKTFYWTIQARDAYGSTYRPDVRSLVSPPGLVGDFNGDGMLDEADCALMTAAFRTSWGDPHFLLAADFDGDRIVRCADYQEWLRRYRAFYQGESRPDPCGVENGADGDMDGAADICENCPAVSNAGQEDADADGVGDVCDNCPTIFNPDQADTDGDGLPDGCDNCPQVANSDQLDTDQDEVGDVCDNCPTLANRSQADIDADGAGDVCDWCELDAANDADGDGVCGNEDNCPALANPDQADTDSDGVGDVCDNCMAVSNPEQADTDLDSVGDACDEDLDGDGVPNAQDNCARVSNPDQLDTEQDGVGDICDNCPNVANPDQCDMDSNGVGDACRAQTDPPILAALRFDGQSQHATVPDHSAMHFGENDFTVELWFRANTATGYILDKRGISRPVGFCVLLNASGQVLFELDYLLVYQRKIAASSLAGVADGRWHHVAGVRGGQELRLYLDGGLAATVPFTDRINVTEGAAMMIGCHRESTTALNGSVDELRIWSEARSESQIRDFMDVNLVGHDLSSLRTLAAYWPIEGGCRYQTVNDLGPNGINGWLGSTPNDYALDAERIVSDVPIEPGADQDSDGVIDVLDNCPATANAGQENSDADHIGDACDNCPNTPNADQKDMDGDSLGDACDPDIDGDGVPNESDVCPFLADPGQEDRDHDGVGDVCDACPTSVRGMPVDADGCSALSLPGDLDRDGDVDQEDFGLFQACLSGPEVAYASGCASADLDRDNHVEQRDVVLLQRCLSGSGIAGNPNCAN